jgi:asparagine synthase (glutamine-hydrolysing)
MLELMKHRSPDGMNVSPGNFAMGMGRLAIIDTENKEFPMTRDGYTVAFNGEIYNYEELRTELEACGNVLSSHTDTEVLLVSFMVWGERCVDHFNGMFAFAIRCPNGSIFCARDAAGEKPFYFTKEIFSFASEAKALDFNCYELPRGHQLWYKKNDIFISQWYFPQVVDIPANFDTALSVLENLLEDSIRLRTRADVPYGLYLSDGVDSNLIGSFHTFDHYFTYRDGDYRDEFHRVLPTIVHHLDFPVASFSPYGLYKLAHEAQESGVKVILSGEGADELFGGYVRYIPNEFNRIARGFYPSYKTVFPYRDMMRQEFDGNMQELLRMGDRMASAHGVENRCPFLDKRIMEFAWSLPEEWKIDGLTTKVMLRELLRKRDNSYQFKEKHGLFCSVNEWLGAKSNFDKKAWLEAQQKIWIQQASSTRIGQ